MRAGCGQLERESRRGAGYLCMNVRGHDVLGRRARLVSVQVCYSLHVTAGWMHGLKRALAGGCSAPRPPQAVGDAVAFVHSRRGVGASIVTAQKCRWHAETKLQDGLLRCGSRQPGVGAQAKVGTTTYR